MGRLTGLFLSVLALLVACSSPVGHPTSVGPGLFHGGLNIQNADPSAILVGQNYYSVEQRDGARLYVRTCPVDRGLEGLSAASGSLVYTLPSGWSELWAPEFLFYEGTYYLYFTVKTNPGDEASHRMVVIESDRPDGGYGSASALALPEDRWAIDGAPFRLGKQWWFVWSGWAGTTNVEQNLYLCKMASPTAPYGPRWVISQPREAWERQETQPAVNEGPQPVLDPDGRLHIVYSANGSWGINYGLVDLRLKLGGDPTVVGDWFKSPGLVFSSNASILTPGTSPTTLAKGVGHHSFVLYQENSGVGSPSASPFPVLYHGVPMDHYPNPFWFGRYWYAGSGSWVPSVSYTKGGVSDLGYGLTFSE